MLQNQHIQPGTLEQMVRELDEAAQRAVRITETLQDCQRVFREMSAKEYAEANAQKLSQNHSSDYCGDDNHGYNDESRPNGTGQPDAKKIRRGVSVLGIAFPDGLV
jgi:hypothetical protein